MQDGASRLRTRVQFTTDGHKPYVDAVEDAFGADIDRATRTKIYGEDRAGVCGAKPPDQVLEGRERTA